MVEPSTEESYGGSQVEDHQLRFDSNIPNLEADNFAITIIVCDPVVKDGMSKYVLYTIKGTDKDGPFEAFRRYSDFFHLREILLQRWPGCYIPPIPPKKALGNKEAKFIEDRRRELETFCVKIAAIKHIFYSDEFRVFLKANANDVEKNLNALPKQSFENLIEKYQINFKMLSGREINTELVLKITSFESFLRRVKVMMDNFKQMAKNTAVGRKNFSEKFNTFSNYLMPEYEKNCLVEYTGGGEDRLIFGNTNDTKLNAIINSIKDANNTNAYDLIQDKIKTELKEISAFLDSLNGKKNYENLKEKAQQKQKEQQLELQKVLAGKTTMKSLFTRGSKEDTIANLEKAISATTKEVENLQFICDIITVILGYIEIDKFKSEKQQIYYSLMRRVCEFEINYSRGMLELWSYVSQNPNLTLSE